MKLSYDSLAYNALIRSFRRVRHTRLASLWWRLYLHFRSRGRPVRTMLHGYPVALNFGYPYPLTIRTYPGFNAPLLELIQIAHRARNRKLRFVDVGAAIGDTVLLVESNCPGAISEYICIDGDKELFSYLAENLAPIASKKLIQAQLSRTGGARPDLVKVRPDCISSQGSESAQTLSLEQAFELHEVGPVDVLKIDVEGYDGEVLLGCESRIRKDLPAVLFEWHPIVCQQAGTTYSEHFEMLQGLGYGSFLWFNKFGEFSHFSSMDESPAGHSSDMKRLATYCLNSKVRDDWHYDVVALPPDLESQWLAMAELEFASHRRSWA